MQLILFGEPWTPTFFCRKRPRAFLGICFCVIFCVAQISAQSLAPSDPDPDLPSAPEPHLSSGTDAKSNINEHPISLQECPHTDIHATECRVHWHQLVISSTLFITSLNAGNLYTGYWYRY